ncbi:NYN domain-containing protein [Chelativorans sp.]|uniref:NYN domain-containing protein n=1 Tax=Chelativorans sp. TaxID=2203393 RepID=UPI0028116FDF|nr:NYN domain-containing protein [Chelativorans sp.]
MTIRSALYVDGFNLYHAVKDLNEPFLKWCNLWRLGEIIIPSKSEKLVKVVFCSAYYPGDQAKRWRHDQLMNALHIAGVECVLGHYIHEEWVCRECSSPWQKPTEKASDLNLGLSLITDAWNDVFDRAYLLTADSDQTATARFLHESFPKKSLITVAPPGRNFSANIERFAAGRIALSREHLERSVFPATVLGTNMPHGRRPREYDPPAGWIHPDHRKPVETKPAPTK